MALGAGPSPQGHRLRSGRPPAEEPDVLDLIMLQRGSGRSLASMEIWLTLRSHPRWPAATGAQSTRERPSRYTIASRQFHSARPRLMAAGRTAPTTCLPVVDTVPPPRRHWWGAMRPRDGKTRHHSGERIFLAGRKGQDISTDPLN